MPTNAAELIFILTGSSLQYTAARRKLGLSPSHATWLTRPSNLVGQQQPKVVRYGDWKSLVRLAEIEAKMTEVAAQIRDL